MSDAVMLPLVDCWNSIGVKGDRSCPKLKDAIHCHNCGVFADAARAFLDRPAPASYSSEVTASFTHAAVSKRSEAISALVFEVGEQLLAIDSKAVVEVTSPRRAHRVGHRSGRIFSGIVNIHGQLELCCSLSGLLHIETLAGDSDRPSARMLLVEHAGLRWAFEVDAVLGVQRFEAEQVSAVPATSQQDATSFMRSVLGFGERRAGQLDLEKTFRALESNLR
ncbi:MAG TPA: chemotaxis protein CheW [Polyangiaceae bacterium]|nr:chemotaxis protein CheW [Polyangiaceae bacterium]